MTSERNQKQVHEICRIMDRRSDVKDVLVAQIARLESNGYTGSVRTLAEYVAACGKKLKISLE